MSDFFKILLGLLIAYAFILITGCASKTPPVQPQATAVVPAALVPPKPHAIMKRTAFVAQPPARTMPLFWTYRGPPATFNLWSTTDLKIWTLRTNTTEFSIRIPLRQPGEMFAITATNGTRESVHYWEKKP